MESKKVVINTDSLTEASKYAKEHGKTIKSFDVFEISIVAGGIFELGSIENIKYVDDINSATQSAIKS